MVEEPHNGVVVPPIESPALPSVRLLDIIQTGGGNLQADQLERIVGLFREEQDRAAKREFAAAMARFQQECPSVPKDKTAKFVSKKSGTTVTYSYAPLSTIKRVVGPVLHKHGFGFSWDSEFAERHVKVTCTLTHENGHTRSATFMAPIDGTPMMSDAQKAKSALTFSQRVSLVQVLGLTDVDEDDDHGAHGGADVRISDVQVAELQDYMRSLDMSDESVQRFLSHLGADSLGSIYAGQFEHARRILQEKYQRMRAEATSE